MASASITPTSRQAALAFLNAGLLARYETTFAYLPGGLASRALRATPYGRRLERQLMRRALDDIPPTLVRRNPGLELLRTAASVLGASEVMTDRLWERMTREFDAGVAARLGPEVGLVYGYEHGCRRAFERAGQIGVGRVYDMAALHYTVTDSLIDTQLAEFPELVTDYWRAMRAKRALRNAHKQHEIDLADLVIANSSLTARTLVDARCPRAKIRVVPLAAPPIDPRWRTDGNRARLRFLYAGTLAVHKGVHHLLDAWRALGAVPCELVLVGKWCLPERFRRELPAGVRVLDRLPQRELFDLYRRCDLLVFPTLADGFGLVVTEAMAHGLPVLTTRLAGSADLIEHDVNGWVVAPGDQTELASRLAWCIEHPAELRAMREAAEATAARNQWADYRRKLVEAVIAFFASGARSDG